MSRLDELYFQLSWLDGELDGQDNWASNDEQRLFDLTQAKNDVQDEIDLIERAEAESG